MNPNDIELLEDKIDRLIAKCQQLNDENQQLTQKNALAMQKVQDIIAKLAIVENET